MAPANRAAAHRIFRTSGKILIRVRRNQGGRDFSKSPGHQDIVLLISRTPLGIQPEFLVEPSEFHRARLNTASLYSIPKLPAPITDQWHGGTGHEAEATFRIRCSSFIGSRPLRQLLKSMVAMRPRCCSR